MEWSQTHALCPTGDTRPGLFRAWRWLAWLTALSAIVPDLPAQDLPAAAHFRKDIAPILDQYCSDCHEDGANKGGVVFDEFKTDEAILAKRDLWVEVLKNVRGGLMPPQKKPRPSAEERRQLENWIKYDAFGLDPKNPDPGRATVRRLNRVEYHNTIHDLIGVDFNTENEFPPDDSGHGFDNIADVLTLSPMLLEKYLAAARTIVEKAVPMVAKLPAEKVIAGRQFHTNDTASGEMGYGPLTLSYYKPATAKGSVHLDHAGQYKLVVDLTANEKYVDNQFDYNKCRIVFKADGQELLKQEFVREGGKPFHFEFDRDWPAGDHPMSFELEPLTPDQKQIRTLTLRIDSVTVRGPSDPKYWVAPKNYSHFFPKAVPKAAAERRAYAGELLSAFATKAFRRPVDQETADRLAALAESAYRLPGATFESGVAQAMVAVLASPRFLFREEGTETAHAGQGHPLVDEYSLASRLSYFLWSSMPDEELFRLAHEGNLRRELGAQLKRMLADSRSEAFVQNFSGQWLQARDIETVQIEARSVLARDSGNGGRGRGAGSGGFGRLRADLDGELRRAMRRETEMYFAHIVRDDRNVIELLDSDYAYLNERLAKHYGLTNLDVTGTEIRRVTLPAGSPRGGVLTQGTILAVTSNPTRTSPVKRGLFVLDNILGITVPPPPPDIPPLEDASKGFKDHTPTLRETLELHRAKPLCSSCHNRMDPLGLALENFNAMGMWRETEGTNVLDTAGKLITGEEFKDIQGLKHILATDHRLDFYRTLTEKLLTYALGRGLEYYDVPTVDEIVERLDRANGHFSALLDGIVESAPFQKRRSPSALAESEPVKSQEQRADLRKKP